MHSHRATPFGQVCALQNVRLVMLFGISDSVFRPSRSSLGLERTAVFYGNSARIYAMMGKPEIGGLDILRDWIPLSPSSSLVGSTQPLFSALSSEREGKFNHAYSCPLCISRSRGYRDRRCYLQLGACSPKSGINYLSRSCPSRLCHKRTWKRAAGNSRNVSCILTLETANRLSWRTLRGNNKLKKKVKGRKNKTSSLNAQQRHAFDLPARRWVKHKKQINCRGER